MVGQEVEDPLVDHELSDPLLQEQRNAEEDDEKKHFLWYTKTEWDELL